MIVFAAFLLGLVLGIVGALAMVAWSQRGEGDFVSGQTLRDAAAREGRQ